MSAPFPSKTFLSGFVPGWLFLMGLMSLVGLIGLMSLVGCGQGVWPDRQPVVAENIRIDSLQFVPSGWRFIFIDSTTRIRMRGIHLGYRCSEILELGLDSARNGGSLTFRPKSRIRLPADPDCPVDSARGRDSVFAHVFKSGADTAVILRNSSDSVTAKAALVRGRVSYDSIEKVLGIAHSVDQGRLFYRDTLGSLLRQLSSDSLTSCEYLNQATVAKRGDTVKVRLSLVTLDSASVPDACRGTRRDSIPVSLYVP